MPYWSPAEENNRLREKAERADRNRLPLLLAEIAAQGGLMLEPQAKELRAIHRILRLPLTVDRTDFRTGETVRLTIDPKDATD